MRLLLALVLLVPMNVEAQKGRLIPNPVRNIPRWVRSEFSSQQLDQRYDITYQMYPRYLKADFNGDGKTDIAISVTEKSSGKLGIAIIHGKQAQAFKNRIMILGAGKPLGDVGDDFKWMNLWSIVKNKKSLRENSEAHLPPFQGAVMRIEKRDTSAGLIYWEGKKYEWYSLGQ